MTTPRFHPATRVLFCVLGILGLQLLVYKVLEAGNLLSTAFTELPPTESFEEMIERFALLITLLTYPACLVWIGVCRQKWDRASFLSLGLRPISVGKNLLSGALCGFLAVGVLWTILWLSGAIEVFGYSPESFELGALSFGPLTLYFAAFCAVACFEEILFRGYILHNLNRWLGWSAAVALQAALFAVVHLGNVLTGTPKEQVSALWALPSLFLIGIFFAQAARKTGGLWFPIAFHALWNFALGCLFSLPVSGLSTFRLLDVEATSDSLLSGGSFGAEASLYLPFLLLSLIWAFRGVRNHPQFDFDLALLTRNDTSIPLETNRTGAETEDDENRENRFQTKFGTQTGFDSQMLRELRELQRAREENTKQKPQVTVTDMPLVRDEPLDAQGQLTSEINRAPLEQKKLANNQEKTAQKQEKPTNEENEVVEENKVAEDKPSAVEEEPVVRPQKPTGETQKPPETTQKKASPRW